MRVMAEKEHVHIISFEAEEQMGLIAQLAPRLRSLLFELDRIEGAKEKIVRAFAVLRSFASTFKASFNGIDLGLDIRTKPKI